MEGNIDLQNQNAQQEQNEVTATESTAFVKRNQSSFDIFSNFSLKKLLAFIGAAIGLGALLFAGWLGYLKLTNRPMALPSFTLTKLSKEGTTVEEEKSSITHPINGVLYTSQQAEEWQERRPMAVMINNHAEARPQKGLSQADLIYEAVAEGGISRFLAIFHSKIPQTVGPVRSARVYYIDWAKEYDAWYAHWGHAQGNNEANAFARMQSIFVSSIESGKACEYDESLVDRAIEHTLYCEPETLYEVAYELYSDQPKAFRSITPWEFKDERIVPGSTDVASNISFNFWDLPEYSVEWKYNTQTNLYERYQDNQQQIDALNNQPLTGANIIVAFMQERQLNDEKQHLIYEDIGTGDALVFLDGRVEEAEWKRLAYADRTIFTSKATGEEIKFNRGQVWVEVVPDRNEDAVVYN